MTGKEIVMNATAPSRRRVLGLRRMTWFVPLVALAVVLSACGGATKGSAPLQSPEIPWVATPGHALQSQVAQSASAPCGPADLSVSPGPPAEINGIRVENLRLTNVSATACELTSPPTVTWALPSGATAATSLGAYAQAMVALAPGESATFDVGAPATCASYNPAAPNLASPTSATLPGGGTLALANAAQLDLQCGLPQVAEFFADATTSPPTSGEAALQVAIEAPSSMSVGTTYQYIVTLTNPTTTGINLLPCPSYTEGLTGTSGILNSATYVLNCQSVGQLAPGASATFQMMYLVPATLSTGPAKFWWVIQVTDGPSGGSVVQVS